MSAVKWLAFWVAFVVLVTGLHYYQPFRSWGVDGYVVTDPLGTSSAGLTREAQASTEAPSELPVEASTEAAHAAAQSDLGSSLGGVSEGANSDSEPQTQPPLDSSQGSVATALEQQIANVPVSELPPVRFELRLSKRGAGAGAPALTAGVDAVEVQRESLAKLNAKDDASLSEAEALAVAPRETDSETGSQDKNPVLNSTTGGEASTEKVASAAQPEPAPPRIYETLTPLNYRDGPGREFRLLGTLPSGSRVEVVGEEGGWYSIRTKNTLPAYVRSKYLRPVLAN